MATICLNMIVKNESKIITRLFDSILPLIDTYCICDTGSTDNTVDIIEQYLNKRIFQESFFMNHSKILDIIVLLPLKLQKIWPPIFCY